MNIFYHQGILNAKSQRAHCIKGDMALEGILASLMTVRRAAAPTGKNADCYPS